MVQRRYITLLLVLAIFLGSVYAAAQIGVDFGGVNVKEVTIQAQGYSIRGTLYTPNGVSGKVPAFVLAHGVSNAKETLGGPALELARNGYVALTIDEKGHGESDTGIGVTDSTLGLGSAVTYLASLPDVDANRIGVAGHSMGAGAVRATVSQNPTIAATILIGGGQSDSTAYAPMNETRPRNLLFIVGRNDVLFNVTSLYAYLRPVFGTNGAISPGTTYGEFGDGTARRLVLLETIHLLEPVDPKTAEEVVSWANSALKPQFSYPLDVKAQTYLLRESLMAVALVAFTASIIPLSQILNGVIPGGVGEATTVRNRFLRERRVLLLWSLLGLVLYLPGMLLGTFVPFPPLLFGASMAWWLLACGVIGLLILAFMAWRRPKGSVSILGYFREAFKIRDIVLSVLLFCLLYAMAYASSNILGEKLRLLVPIFVPLTSSRASVFPLFIPFYLIYFAAESLYLHVYRGRQTAGSTAGNMIRTLLLKLAPYFALLALQYLPMFAANYRLISGSLGFFIEFIWAIVPLLAISTFASWWLYRHTGRIWAGVLLNALLFAWVSSGLFPFTAFG
ncbi:MAG: alpha/beta hydrolase [Candidatus Bathyarchaeota archaeon]|nr:alpha/beta hydrolase [Candidatus Bathyarchaeota archaeon]